MKEIYPRPSRELCWNGCQCTNRWLDNKAKSRSWIITVQIKWPGSRWRVSVEANEDMRVCLWGKGPLVANSNTRVRTLLLGGFAVDTCWSKFIALPRDKSQSLDHSLTSWKDIIEASHTFLRLRLHSAQPCLDFLWLLRIMIRGVRRATLSNESEMNYT